MGLLPPLPFPPHIPTHPTKCNTTRDGHRLAHTYPYPVGWIMRWSGEGRGGFHSRGFHPRQVSSLPASLTEQWRDSSSFYDRELDSPGAHLMSLTIVGKCKLTSSLVLKNISISSLRLLLQHTPAQARWTRMIRSIKSDLRKCATLPIPDARGPRAWSGPRAPLLII